MLRFLLLLSLAGKIVAIGLWRLREPFLVDAAFFAGPDLLIAYNIFAPAAQGLCRICTRFETASREIWLTIDDGPDPQDTPMILELLDRHRARATFFFVGERAARFPELVAAVVVRGHEVGHHTHTHPMKWFWCATPARLRAELDDALDAFQAAGIRPRWFRSPVGIKNLLLGPALDERGLRYIGWSVRSYDVRSRSPAAVRDGVMKQVRPGAIVLMHEGPAMDARVRVTALTMLLDALAARGFACVLPAAGQLR